MTFANQYFHALPAKEIDSISVLFSYEAWFKLSGYTNSYCKSNLSADNHMSIHEVPGHEIKVSV